ncbi:MAG: glycerol-3-phosphate 1-O-acyltransferase PlsY [Hyphomicrobiales bacterium]|nr:glycerol-3-phosphate 1-O-acyltransferase PlsY [Hyphomicrobiales bacterium]MBV8825767.1 glycerol-3-phosphate 1-O-acyltransferase PlsY [Hyphomicrobiales bacterium]
MTLGSWIGMLIALALGYLLGSIPFGLLLTRVAGTQNIRAIGSGSIGATNVLRTGRKGLAAATLLCDVLKGTAAVLLADWLFGREPALVAGFGAFLGHLFPVWLGFKGGKGVATYIGILIGIAILGASWIPLVVFAAVWLAVAALTRYSSLAGLTACAATPAVLWATDNEREALLFLLLAVLVFIAHRANIARLINGSEGKISLRRAG